MWRRAEPTLPVRSWQRYGDLRGDRLAGAASFYGFVSLFPLVLLSAVFASAIAGASGIETVQELVDENLPGFGSASSNGIDVSSFYRNGGTVGLISGVGLVYTGLRWVDSVRAAVRSMWRVEDKPGNFVVRKMFDLVALGGLGLLLVASWGTSVVLRQTTRTLLDWLGLDGIDEAGTFQLVSWVLSVGVNTVLFSYLLSGLPRIVVPARNLLVTALLGACVFEVLKTFLVGYVVGPASNSAYAAFATPLAMLAWIYLVTRLLMLLAALTVESALDTLEAQDREYGTHSAKLAVAEGAGTDRRRAMAAARSAAAARAAEDVPVVPEDTQLEPLPVRRERVPGTAARTVLGAAGAGLSFLGGWVARSVVATRRRQ